VGTRLLFPTEEHLRVREFPNRAIAKAFVMLQVTPQNVLQLGKFCSAPCTFVYCEFLQSC